MLRKSPTNTSARRVTSASAADGVAIARQQFGQVVAATAADVEHALRMVRARDRLDRAQRTRFDEPRDRRHALGLVAAPEERSLGALHQVGQCTEATRHRVDRILEQRVQRLRLGRVEQPHRRGRQAVGIALLLTRRARSPAPGFLEPSLRLETARPRCNQIGREAEPIGKRLRILRRAQRFE
jgi:hypothetical protein